MYGEIIAVGEEVLAGDVINSNAATISRMLSEIGVSCRFHSVVGDSIEDITNQLKSAVKRSKVVVLCGGLGPTKDDLTKDAVAKFLNKELVEDSKLIEEINKWYNHRGLTPTPNNYRQGMMIEGGISLVNDNGTAPGVYIVAEGCHLFLLPGPPNELNPMMVDSVIPIIKPLVSSIIRSKTYKLVNIGESSAVTVLDDIMEACEDFIVAPYAKLREVHIKVTAIGEDANFLSQRIAKVDSIIYERLGEYVYSDNGDELIDVIISKLAADKMTVCTAESCTGGLIASSFVEKSGASSVYNEGFITYSNESKVRNLHVDKDLLDNYGAVSAEVAKAMAKGALELTGVDYSISVTGIAGPTGGSDEKPVGLVYIGIGTPSNMYVYEHRFLGNRDKVRDQAAKHALIHLWDLL